LIPRTIRKKLLTPQYWPQLLRTFQKGTPSSSPHPTTSCHTKTEHSSVTTATSYILATKYGVQHAGSASGSTEHLGTHHIMVYVRVSRCVIVDSAVIPVVNKHRDGGRVPVCVDIITA
jgi:hypothetical protein